MVRSQVDQATVRPAQPLGHGSRIEAHTGADPEGGYPSGLGLFEDGLLADTKDLGQLLGGQGMTDLLDVIRDAHFSSSPI